MDFMKNCNYCLHDCYIDKIESKKSTLILYFNYGVYKYDGTSVDNKLTDKCKLLIKIDSLKEKEEYEHISIFKKRKNKIKEIEFNKFLLLTEKNKFKIYLDFYSRFAKAILLKGFIKNIEIELTITEINDMQFLFYEL